MSTLFLSHVLREGSPGVGHVLQIEREHVIPLFPYAPGAVPDSRVYACTYWFLVGSVYYIGIIYPYSRRRTSKCRAIGIPRASFVVASSGVMSKNPRH